MLLFKTLSSDRPEDWHDGARVATGLLSAAPFAGVPNVGSRRYAQLFVPLHPFYYVQCEKSKGARA